MSKTIIICGDSFNAGIGCRNMLTQPYGVLVAKHFNANLIMLARGSASNYNIHLQAIYATGLKPDLLIVGTTSCDRYDWIAEGKQTPFTLTAPNINYHDYPPHSHPWGDSDRPIPFYFDGDREYDPILLSEQIDAIEARANTNKFVDRLSKEPSKKMQQLLDYAVHIMPYTVKKSQDEGVILRSYCIAKKAGINTIVVGGHATLEDVVHAQDYMHHDWFVFSKEYPDTIGSMHASEEGHAVFAEKLIKKIEENGYI